MVCEQVTRVGASVYPLKDGVMTAPVSVRLPQHADHAPALLVVAPLHVHEIRVSLRQ